MDGTPRVSGNASLLDEARRRLDGGDPRSAMVLAEPILASARASGRPEQIGQAAQLMGECHYVIGDVATAWSLAEEAVRADEEGSDDASLGSSLNLLGVLQITAGRLDEAERTLRRSYDLRAAALGPDDEDAIESLNNVAVAMWRSGRHEEAIALHEESLRRCERALGEGHRRTAETLNALAVKVAALPDGGERARALYERALTAAELGIGPESDLVGRLLANVGMSYVNMGQPDRARPMLERALTLHERHFGPMSRWTAVVLEAIGNLAFAEGRYADAREAFERTFLIRIDELGPDHRETVDAALALVTVFSKLASEGQHGTDGDAVAEATAIYLPILTLRPDLAPPFFSDAQLTRDEAAEQLRTIARRFAARRAPESGQPVARARAESLLHEADAAFVTGNLVTAQDRVREAIGLLDSAFGTDSTELVEPLRRLRLILRLAGTEAEVLPILERITAILAGAYGRGHPLAVQALGEQYWQELREYGPAGGRATATRIEQLTERMLGPANPVARAIVGAIESARDSLPSDAQPDEVALSARRERFLSEPTRLVEELLGDLANVDWRALSHAYGRAIDTPMHLRTLLADDERLRADGRQLLTESVLHGGSIYPATAPVLRFVRRMVVDARVRGRSDLLELLLAAQRSAGDDPDVAAELGDLPGLLSRLAAADPEPHLQEAALKALSSIAGTDRGN